MKKKNKRFLWFEHDVEFSGKSIEQITRGIDIRVCMHVIVINRRENPLFRH